MEVSEENTLDSDFKQANMSFFFLLQNQRTEGRNGSYLGVGGGWYQWEQEKVGKGYRRVNMVQILCTHVCKWKNQTCETISGMGRWIKENGVGYEFKYGIFGIL
jgi:hypothetical protein